MSAPTGADRQASARPPAARIGPALFALGVYAQVAQALLARESLVVFYGNEVSLGAFFGSWLLWVAVGAAAAVGLRRRIAGPAALDWLRHLVVAMPVLLALQVVAVRLVRLTLDVPAVELMPFGQLVAATLLTTLPTSLALGLAFPLACEGLSAPDRTGVETASRLYVVEALGALLGGLLFTFVMVEWLGVWRSLGVASAALGGVALSLGGRWDRGLAMLDVAFGVALALTPLGGTLDAAMERVRFRVLQPGLELLDAVETRYGHVALGRRGTQVSRVIDGRVADSWPDSRRVEQEAAYYFGQGGSPRRLLLFGGLEDGLAAELLRYPIEHVTVVEPDATAFERTRPYLDAATRSALGDPRLTLVFQDGPRFVNALRGDERYDLVLVLGVDPSTAHSNRYFTLDFYSRLARAMAPAGVLCTAVSGASNYLGREVRSYGGSVYRTLKAAFADVALAPGDTYVLCAGRTAGVVTTDPAQLEARYRATALDEHRFPAGAFADLLPRERVAFAREALEAEAAEVNTGERPVAYYLNMVLWGKLSASQFVEWLEALRKLGPWPYLIPAAVLALLLPLRGAMEGTPQARRGRQAGTFALVAVGLVAMAGQLALLYSYQAHVGFVFGRIALLNAVFMAGLALGAGGPGGRLARAPRAGLRLAALLAALAGCLTGLPLILGHLGGVDAAWQEPLYLLLSTALGVLTGAAFPLGVALAHREVPQVLNASGVTQAADQLGGALGGFLAGSLLVPLLGTDGCLRVLAGISVLAAIPAVVAELPGAAPAALRARGYRAFPWPVFSWGLLALVLAGGLLALAGGNGERQPVLRFADEALAALSGSRRFEYRRDPFVHYLGTGRAEAGAGADGEAASPRTVTLASRAVPEAAVSGHGGPLNLLVSVDESGVLRGVRHVESSETPAYVEGIDRWLEGLAGRDLRGAPLDLERYDALSGATVTSRAALETVRRTAAAAGRTAFALELPGTTAEGRGAVWSWGLLATAALLTAFFPVYRSGRDAVRLIYQGAALLVLGVWLNALITEADLVNVTLGRVPGLSGGGVWYLLAGFVVVTAVLFGQAYCGYVCPFGALQEALSRAGRYLRFRRYAARWIDTPLRQLKFILLALMLLAVWVTRDTRWAAFNPMQYVFGGRVAGWVLLITAVSLVGSVVYYRFWCRYFCPFGAFLALFNKLALARGLGPRRRFEHCDLGVRDEYDVDCIHCHRCVSGRDFGVRPDPPPGAPPPPGL